MKSSDRIIRDIRFCETKPKNFVGNFNGIIGNVYQITEDTNSIAQRIARKLNEFGFLSGEFDHIYINFTENIDIGKVIESDKFLDKRIKYVDYGIDQKSFNLLTESEKNQEVKEITFKSLFLLYKKEKEKLEKIIEVENLINKFETEIEISFKTKETSLYKIEISYKINPRKTLSKIVIRYFDKKNNSQKIATKNLHFYEDIFYLVDKIEVKNDKIIFNHKKTALGDIATAKYKKPIEVEINEMVNYNSL